MSDIIHTPTLEDWDHKENRFADESEMATHQETIWRDEAIKAASVPLAPGEAGECEECETQSPRLVREGGRPVVKMENGKQVIKIEGGLLLCAPCRDIAAKLKRLRG